MSHDRNSSEITQNENGESKPRGKTSKRARDDFTQATINTLARRVNFRCSNPDHGVATAGPHSDPHKAQNIGEAAHIEAAAGGGPRANPALSVQERKDINNGIWLCKICHKMVDSDEEKYTVAVLRQWKLEAEQRAEFELGVTMPWLHQTSEPGEPTLLEPPPEEELPDPGRLPQGSWVPFLRNKVFTGREEDLKSLGKLLLYKPLADTTGVGIVEAVAATGIGGIGKTQIAVEFCYRYGRYFRGVHWVAANEEFPYGIAFCGEKMNLEFWPKELPEQVRMTLQAMHKSGSRLVVLDNLENPQDLQKWLVELDNVHVLVTSRRQAWPQDLGLALYELKTLPREESLALLRKLAPRLAKVPDEGLDEIAEQLGDLPLALDLAGRYLQDRRMLSTAGFLAELDEAGSVLEHSALKDWTEHNPTLHDVNLAKTFLQSWNRLDSEEAKLLFRTCGFCAANRSIPWKLLKESVGVGEADLDRHLRRLADLGLVNSEETGIVIHPLLADFSRLQDEEAETSALPGLWEAFLIVANELNIQMYPIRQLLPPHEWTITKHMETNATIVPDHSTVALDGNNWITQFSKSLRKKLSNWKLQ